jgi:predicted nucleic acid-binding protein
VTVCVDSWAVIAWLQGVQPANDRLGSVIGRRPVISWINLVEVYYRVERDHGRARADEVTADLRRRLLPDLPGTARMVAAARLKSANAIALGDCFALATAAAHGLTLWTGDPEILELDDPPCEVEDLRAADVSGP